MHKVKTISSLIFNQYLKATLKIWQVAICSTQICQCMWICSCSVTKSCLTVTPWTAACMWISCVFSCWRFCNPMDCSRPGSFVHGISQARILGWVAISFSKGSSQPRDWTGVSCIAGGFFTNWAIREALLISCIILAIQNSKKTWIQGWRFNKIIFTPSWRHS